MKYAFLTPHHPVKLSPTQARVWSDLPKKANGCLDLRSAKVSTFVGTVLSKAKSKA